MYNNDFKVSGAHPDFLTGGTGGWGYIKFMFDFKGML